MWCSSVLHILLFCLTNTATLTLTWMPSRSLLMHQKLSASMFLSASSWRLDTSKFSTSSSVEERERGMKRVRKVIKKKLNKGKETCECVNIKMGGTEKGFCYSKKRKIEGLSTHSLTLSFLPPGFLASVITNTSVHMKALQK